MKVEVIAFKQLGAKLGVDLSELGIGGEKMSLGEDSGFVQSRAWNCWHGEKSWHAPIIAGSVQRHKHVRIIDRWKRRME